jgi:hypothetical protein
MFDLSALSLFDDVKLQFYFFISSFNLMNGYSCLLNGGFLRLKCNYSNYKKLEKLKNWGWIEILPRLNPISYEKPSLRSLPLQQPSNYIKCF